MFCLKCGNEIPDESAFCPKCGAKQVKPQTGAFEKQEEAPSERPSEPERTYMTVEPGKAVGTCDRCGRLFFLDEGFCQICNMPATNTEINEEDSESTDTKAPEAGPLPKPQESGTEQVSAPQQQEPGREQTDVKKTFICPNCGTENQPGNLFCEECGAKLS